MLSAPYRRENRIPFFVKLYFGLVGSRFRICGLVSILNVNLCINNQNTLFFLELLFKILLHLESMASCPLIIAIDLISSPWLKVHLGSESTIEFLNRQLIFQLELSSWLSVKQFAISIFLVENSSLVKVDILHYVRRMATLLFLENYFFHNLRFSLF